MKKKVFFGLLVTVMMLAVATAGCTSSTNSSSGGSSQPAASTVPAATFVPQNNPGYLNYTNATAGVRIQYPSGWNVTEGNGSIVTFSPPGGVAANVILNSSNMSGIKPSLDEVKTVLTNDLLNNSTISYSVVSTENTTLAGMPAFTLNLNATTSGISIKQEVASTLKDYQAYELIYSATQGVFPDYQSDFSNMTNSFAITS
jgi:hypothetical protein